jgi:hypothetical protein
MLNAWIERCSYVKARTPNSGHSTTIRLVVETLRDPIMLFLRSKLTSVDTSSDLYAGYGATCTASVISRATEALKPGQSGRQDAIKRVRSQFSLL